MTCTYHAALPIRPNLDFKARPKQDIGALSLGAVLPSLDLNKLFIVSRPQSKQGSLPVFMPSIDI
jgi:hypothetical protein